jgi:glyoxylase-like metal-dependent hydrolase (beta-lactamase superfamily II)
LKRRQADLAQNKSRTLRSNLIFEGGDAMHAVAVGDVQLIVLDDGSFPFPARYFFSNVPEATWRKELATDAAGKIPVGHNYALLKSAGELIVIDTGYGDDTHGGRTGHLLEEFARTGHRREDVSMVVNTHAHGDHTSRNTCREGGRTRPAFPNARYYLGRADWDRFNGPDGQVHHFDQHLRSLAEMGMLVLVDGALQLTPDVSLLPTPGHTPGHMSVLIQSRDNMALYLGDLCHHPLHFAHPDWVSCFDTDPGQTPATRGAVFRMALENDALLICPHAPAPGLGRLQAFNRGVIWAPAT